MPFLENISPLIFGAALNADQTKTIKSSVVVKTIKRLFNQSEMPVFTKPTLFSIVKIKKVLTTVSKKPTGPALRELLHFERLVPRPKSNNSFSFSKDCCSYADHRRSTFNPKLKITAHSH